MLRSISSLCCYFYKHISTTHSPYTWLLRKDCSSGLQPRSCLFGHNARLSTIDTCITTLDQSVRHTDFKIHPQIPNLTLPLLLPWQQHYSSPHTLLTVSSMLKGISRVTDRVIYHTCHQAQRLLLSLQQLWSASGTATCFRQAWPCFIRLLSNLLMVEIHVREKMMLTPCEIGEVKTVKKMSHVICQVAKEKKKERRNPTLYTSCSISIYVYCQCYVSVQNILSWHFNDCSSLSLCPLLPLAKWMCSLDKWNWSCVSWLPDLFIVVTCRTLLWLH